MEPSENDGSIAAATDALSKMLPEDSLNFGQPPEEPEEPKTEPKVEQPEETKTEEPKEEPSDVEIEYEGSKYKLPPELKDAFLRHADYTRKTQEIAQQRKEFEAKANDLKAVDEYKTKLTHYEKLLIDASQNDEVKLAEINRQLVDIDPNADPMKVVQLTHQKAMLETRLAQANELKAKRDEEDKANHRQTMTREWEQLIAKRPEWKDGATWEADREKMKSFLQGSGYSLDEANSVVDHRALLIADKARKYDELMAGKVETEKKVQKLPPKVERPGVPSASDGQAQRDAMSRLRKSHSIDDAAAALRHLFN